ncbi:MAG TPA: D-alanine--D-alanine ligase [Stenomitos sp.]
MTKKTRVAVLWGGFSTEREVSSWSCEMVRRNLDPEAYELSVYDLNEFLPGGNRHWLDLKASTDVVFIAIHGAGGEDGTVQGLLELHGIPYTGSGVLASALAMNKARTKEIYRQAGIATADSFTYDLRIEPGVSVSEAKEQVGVAFGWPVVLKADNQGSSFGVYIVRSPEEFESAWHEAAKLSPELLIERFIPGLEVTCGVLGGAKVEALPVIEIVPKSEWFDFEAKYKAGGSDEIVPARISAELTARIQDLAVRAHRALGCWGMSRTDMRITEAGEIYVLETNTIPGLTENSLLPKAARAAGIMLPEMLDRIIQMAFERSSFRVATKV